LSEAPPLQRFFDLGRLSDAGHEIILAPSAAELQALAQWAEVSSIEGFTATIELTRKPGNHFLYEARFAADLTQGCVVTLEPVRAHLEGRFSRDLHLTRVSRRSVPEVEVLAAGAGDDEAPEEITSTNYDLAGPVLEEFSLLIDPYPRAPGAAFESGAEEGEAPENPFAVLKSLKTGL
jgi:hypothetical protein